MIDRQELFNPSVSNRALFDFGKDVFSLLEVELDSKGTAGARITVGEEYRDGNLVHRSGSYITFHQTVLKLQDGVHRYRIDLGPFIPPWGLDGGVRLTDGEEIGQGRFFRYVEIDHYYGPARVIRTACYGNWDETKASRFRSSDPALNAVWELCKYSIQATSCFDHFIDGDRERLPYEADALISELGSFCCCANPETARNTIDCFLRFRDRTWPTEWHLFVPRLIREYLLYTGDEDSLRRWLPELEPSLLCALEGPDGLIRGNGRIRDIVDWPPEERDGYELGEVNFVPNALRSDAMEIMAELTGDATWNRKAEELRILLRRTFGKNGSYVDSAASGHTGLHGAVAALLWKIARPEEEAALQEIIREKGMACSVYYAQLLLECAYGCGMSRHAMSLLCSGSRRSWLEMLRAGTTITMEAWNYESKPNLDWNHGWGAAPANIIPRFICGIRPTAPGFRTFLADPKPDRLKEFTFSMNTCRGPIALEWSAGKGKLVLEGDMIPQVPTGTALEIVRK